MSGSVTVKQRRPLIWWGVGLIAVALLAGTVAVIGAVWGVVGVFSDAFGADPYRTPTSMNVQLDTGAYLVYELTGTKRSTDPFSVERTRPLTVRPSDVEVVSADGTQVPVEVPSFSETIGQGAQTYTGAVRFDIVDQGLYRVDVRTADTVVILAPSLSEGLRGALPWLGLGGVSGLVFLVGVVLLIVGLVKGRGASTAPRTAGWYADPQRIATWRWWDGTRWTDRTG